jgi:hypothetical protein
MMNKKSSPSVKEFEKHGIIGSNALWDGPLNTSGFPMGKGSSSGKNGMQLKKYPCKSYDLQEPITTRAKK